MSAKRRESARGWASDMSPLTEEELARIDAHAIQLDEYDDAPELTDEMMARAVVKKGGRPVASNPRKLISIRLPADVIERWKATGPGWQTRMADRLSRMD